MKTKSIQIMIVIFLSSTSIFAQDILESQVPSVILNNFKKDFPKAKDVEWDRQGDQYNVDFEIGWVTDYEAWYSSSGKLNKYTKEISEKDLPKAVKNLIKNQYKGYHIDDVKKITENGLETYDVEIKKGNDELELILSGKGKLIN